MDIDPSYVDWSGSSTRGQITSYLDSVQAVDDYTVKFKAKQVDAQFALIGTRLTAPKHVLGSMSAADLNKADFITNPNVSFGPFKFDAWQKGSQVSLVANTDCYRGAPAVDRYVVRTQPNSQNYATMLKTAEADQASIPVSDYQSLQPEQSITITTVGQPFPDIILMNQDPAKSASQIFGDKAVRQALTYAIDKQAMLQSAYFGLGVVADSIVPPGSWAYSKSINPQYAYDPAKAESVLDNAGWTKGTGGIREKNGLPLRWEVIGYPGFATQAQILQKYWSAIGCDVSIKLGTVPETVDQLLNKRDFAMMLINVGPNIVFPDLRVYVHTKNSAPGGINGSLVNIPSLDALMDQAAATLDRSKQQALFVQIQDLMAQEQPLIPIVAPSSFLGLNKRVQGTQLTPYSWDRSRPWINGEWVSDGK
jgi:peptide/nickel transport system substrate-binding protein